MANSRKHLLHKSSFHWLYTLILFINTGLIAIKSLPDFAPSTLADLDKYIAVTVTLITGELLWRFTIEKKSFFRDYRNLYTLFVLSIFWLTGQIEVTVLLLLSSLKAFNRINFIPKTRHLIATLGHAIPGTANLIVLILMVFIVFAVLGTHLFGAKVPDLWGGLSQSLITLQQMSLSDDWGATLRTTMEQYPYAWIYFQAFVIIVTYILLNLFIGIIVDALQAAQQDTGKTVDSSQQILDELNTLKKQVNQLAQAQMMKPRALPGAKKKVSSPSPSVK